MDPKKYNIIFLVTGLFLFGCAASINYISNFDSTIKIDGMQSDWNGYFNNVKDENIGVGFKNDDQNLYICLVTEDRINMMKILRNGLTIWLRPENGETIGVRFPINYTRDQRVPDFGMMRDRNPENEDSEKMIYNLISKQNEISIVNEDNFPIYAYSAENKEGFKTKLGYSLNQFVYELKVPLAGNKNSKIVLDAMPGEKINLTFETGEIEMPKMGMGGTMPGGQRPEGGRLGRERPGGFGKGDISKMREKLKFECAIKLSSAEN